ISTPRGAHHPVLNGISCTRRQCTAVGRSTIRGGNAVPLAEARDHSRWSAQPTTDAIILLSAGLNAVSCASSSACTAVGEYTKTDDQQLPLAEDWDGTGWTTQAMPSGLESLDAVSCASSNACTAIDQTGAVAHWDGKSWTTQQISAETPIGESSPTLQA